VGLPEGEEITTNLRFDLTQYRLVTDRRTDTLLSQRPALAGLLRCILYHMIISHKTDETTTSIKFFGDLPFFGDRIFPSYTLIVNTALNRPRRCIKIRYFLPISRRVLEMVQDRHTVTIKLP